MTKPAPQRRITPAARPIDPRPGLFLTCALCYPYLSDSMPSFPRSPAHDLVLSAILSVVWGATFFWDALGVWLPLIHTAIRLVFALLIIGGTAALYATALYFMYAR
jgi:hypothetical protein